MVPLGLLEWPDLFRGRQVIWYVDNTPAMAAFVKGASSNPHLEQIVGLTWILAFHLDCQLWFEWVDSDSNWSDDLSRHLAGDTLSQELGFTPEPITQDSVWWQLPWLSLWHEVARRVKDQALEKK